MAKRTTNAENDPNEPKTPRRRAGVKPPPPIDQIPAEEIAAEAYALFLARGGRAGDPLSDWLEAERIVKARRAPKGARRRNRPEVV